jgi:hypothetical protein
MLDIPNLAQYYPCRTGRIIAERVMGYHRKGVRKWVYERCG